MTAARRRGVALAAVAMVLWSLACTADDDRDATGADGATPAAGALAEVAGAAPGSALAPGQVAHDVGLSFQFQSFIVTVGRVVHDADADQLTLGLRFANISGGWAQTDATARLDLADGTSVPITGDLFEVPPGVAVDVTAVASSVPDDPVADGVVTWGGSAYDQPVFRLDGSGGENLWLPAEVPADGWAQIGKFGVHLVGVEVHAAKVDLGIQAEAGRRIVRVLVEELTARGTTSPFDARSNLLLRLPSGDVLDAVDGSPMAAPMSWTAEGGHWADFEVPADLDGDYELLVASIPVVGFGTIRPELIERRPIPFSLTGVAAGSPPGPDAPLPNPRPYPAPTAGTGEHFDVALDAGSMNVPGYDLRPTRLAYDPDTRTATLDAVATSLVSSVEPDDGVLAADATFGLRVVLASDGRLATGLVAGDGIVDPDVPTDLRFEFSDVRSLTPGNGGLYVGPGDGAVASLPLGAGSAVVAWPPELVTRAIDAPEATAGDWSVQLRSYRLGLVNPVLRPALGRRQLEISLEVTASPSAQVRAFGLSFQPRYQVLLGSGTGYDQAAVADSGAVELTPGGRVLLTVTFDVADTFRGGPVPIVIRSRAEYGDIPTFWVETRFLADLTTQVATEEDF